MTQLLSNIIIYLFADLHLGAKFQDKKELPTFCIQLAVLAAYFVFIFYICEKHLGHCHLTKTKKRAYNRLQAPRIF